MRGNGIDEPVRRSPPFCRADEAEHVCGWGYGLEEHSGVLFGDVPGIQMRKTSDVKKTRHEGGTMLLVLILLCSIAVGVGRNEANAKEQRPTHINVDGDQEVIEKAFRPGTQGTDNLSHARRSTIYIGAVRSQKQGLGIGYHRTKEMLFTSRASAFLYAYPTPMSKTTMEAQEARGESRRESTEHGVWIVTCKHAVENEPFIGVRLNTNRGEQPNLRYDGSVVETGRAS